MMASDINFYPQGTDMSYFDIDDYDEDVVCPNCGVIGVQTATARGLWITMSAVCEECGFEWEDKVYKEPYIDVYDDGVLD